MTDLSTSTPIGSPAPAATPAPPHGIAVGPAGYAPALAELAADAGADESLPEGNEAGHEAPPSGSGLSLDMLKGDPSHRAIEQFTTNAELVRALVGDDPADANELYAAWGGDLRLNATLAHKISHEFLDERTRREFEELGLLTHPAILKAAAAIGRRMLSGLDNPLGVIGRDKMSTQDSAQPAAPPNQSRIDAIRELIDETAEKARRENNYSSARVQRRMSELFKQLVAAGG